jgi:hypothetical protein
MKRRFSRGTEVRDGVQIQYEIDKQLLSFRYYTHISMSIIFTDNMGRRALENNEGYELRESQPVGS